METLGVQPEREELCRQILLNNGYTFIEKFKHNEIYIMSNLYV